MKRNALPSASTDPVLEVRDLRVYFRGQDYLSKAVDGVDFTVGGGEIVCLVGESGCGKTVSALTILSLVPRPPAEIPSGRILFKGQDLTALSDSAMQAFRGKEIAMVFQEPMTSLNPLFTIGHQIEEAIVTHEHIDRPTLRRRLIQLLTDVEIPSPETRLVDYPHTLSGGQRQRIMIAMALACDPSLLIADEPTTALDVTVQASILRLLQKFRDERSTAVLLITHNLGVVAEIADRVYVMYAGIIVESGTVEQIFNDPLHPYTMGLLASLPNRAKKGQVLYSIPGSVPDPAFKPPGCPFNPRCRYVQPRCRQQPPALCDFDAGHQARCPVIHGLWERGRMADRRSRLNLPEGMKEGVMLP